MKVQCPRQPSRIAQANHYPAHMWHRMTPQQLRRRQRIATLVHNHPQPTRMDSRTVPTSWEHWLGQRGSTPFQPPPGTRFGHPLGHGRQPPNISCTVPGNMTQNHPPSFRGDHHNQPWLSGPEHHTGQTAQTEPPCHSSHA